MTVRTTYVHEQLIDKQADLNSEFITLTNLGETNADLSAWHVRDSHGAAYRIPDGTELRPTESVAIHTGSGSNTDQRLFWNHGQFVWSTHAGAVVLENAAGDRVDTWERHS